MSDLIEKVARAMCLSRDVDPDYVSDGKIMWHRFDTEARAAIDAVAEWLDENYRSCPCTLSCASILKLEDPK